MTVRTIAILDLWTDANRGDEALQAGLIKLLRDAHPGAHVTGVFRFGTNEMQSALPEIHGSVARLDEALGGLRRTQYAAGARRHPVSRRLADLFSFIEALACVIVFRLLGDGSRSVVGPDRHRTLLAVRSADLVVWKGKNFRDYPGLTAITRSLTLTSAAWFASWLRRDIHCVNASFWRIRPGPQAWVYRAAFRHCRSVTVRDRSSVDHARELLGPRVAVRYCPDLSFAIVREPVVVGNERDPIDVALTLTAWGTRSDQDHYLRALEEAVDALCILGARRFEVVPQVVRAAEDSSQITAELCRALAARGVEMTVRDAPLSIDQLRATYARARMLIGTRMHSCVFARSVGTPFVAVSYDAGPKWEVLSEFWPDHLVIGYTDPSASLVEACRTAWTNGDELVQESQPSWDRCVDGVESNVDLLRG